ncbi:hypothetical protein [Streptomyces sp. NPDC002580]|uniref:hypothetical protein n=1 Tax=Streptomyces sp. NPDC002580 TaxID=3364653 RepID=UPI0036845F81
MRSPSWGAVAPAAAVTLTCAPAHAVSAGTAHAGPAGIARVGTDSGGGRLAGA